MTFVFQCPQGHRLEANVADVGRPAQCPACGQLIEVPTASVGDRAAGRAGTTCPITTVMPITEPTPEFFHIPCPQGHELETPPELVNRPVRCPECGVEFVLRKENSVEFQEAEQRRREAREARAAKIWLRLAIGAGITVLLGIGLLIAFSK